MFFWLILRLSSCTLKIDIDNLVKTSKTVMPDLIRHPEVIEFTGFRLSPEWRFQEILDFLRSRQSWLPINLLEVYRKSSKTPLSLWNGDLFTPMTWLCQWTFAKRSRKYRFNTNWAKNAQLDVHCYTLFVIWQDIISLLIILSPPTSPERERWRAGMVKCDFPHRYLKTNNH